MEKRSRPTRPTSDHFDVFRRDFVGRNPAFSGRMETNQKALKLFVSIRSGLQATCGRLIERPRQRD